MKNAFYFTLKVSPVLKIFLFSIFGFLVMSKNGLIRKIRLISEFMTLQLVNKQLQYTYWPISQSKDKQEMKLDQLIKHNARNIFFEKSYTKCDRDTIPRLFSKKSKLSISVDQYSKVSNYLFSWYAKLRTIKTY